MSANDRMIPGAVKISSGIYLTAEENPGNPQLGDRQKRLRESSPEIPLSQEAGVVLLSPYKCVLRSIKSIFHLFFSLVISIKSFDIFLLSLLNIYKLKVECRLSQSGCTLKIRPHL